MSGDRLRLRDVIEGAIATLPLAPRRAAALPTVLRPDRDREGGLAALVDRAALRWPASTALLFDGERWTWRRFQRRSAALAGALAAAGLGPGDVVAVRCGNRPELLLLIAAVARLGAVSALLNPELQGDALDHALRESGARHRAAEPALVDGLGPSGFALCRGAEEAPGGWIDLMRAEASPARRHPTRLKDPALHVFTSGTTGLPKASVMTHGRWVKAAAVYGRILVGLGPDDVVYCPLPFFHNLALTTAWGACLTTGAALAMAPRFSASRYWDDVREVGATALPYIGELPAFLLAQPPGPGDRLHRARVAWGVGMRPSLWAAFQARFGVERVFESYGASEGNVLFLNVLGLPGSVGFCPASYELLAWDRERGELVRDGDGRPVRAPKGEPGLLVAEVTERYRFDGYTDRAQSEKKLLRDLFEPGDRWFDSGDLLRDVGWWHAAFVDRLGDTFRWKSENVSTTQVEAAIAAQPGVQGCAVYGVEVPGRPGRAGMAAVVGALDVGALAAALRAALPGPAVPVFLRPVDALETTGTYKTRKTALQAEGWDRGDVLVLGPDGYAPLDPPARERIRAGDARF